MSSSIEKLKAENEALVKIIAPILVFPICMYHAWVEWVMWGWFAVPVGMPILGYWQVFGLGLLIARFVSKPPGPDTDPKKLLSWIFVTPMIVLGIAWVVKAMGGL